MAKLKNLTDFLDRLDGADIQYHLTSVNEGAVMVSVTMPSERWEVEFLANGDVEVEVFESDGEIQDEEALERLFEQHAEA